MSPEAAHLVIERMKKVAGRMREIASRTDFHSNLRYKAIIAAEHAEEGIVECEAEIR